ncbi:MAG TPA: twin-arginine translocase subunit TatC [Steroidobacteraceae bacterium]
MTNPEHERETLAEGTLLSHLMELRDRMLRSLISVAILFVPCAYFQDELYTLIALPLLHKLPQGASMIATNPVAPFLVPLKLAFFSALFLAMPYVLYQAWAFVAPGLYRHEKRFALPLIVSSIVLFYCGIAFAYFVVYPLMFEFMATSGPEGVAYTPEIGEYLNFVLLLFFAFGVAFEVPVATVLLAATGLVRIESMTKNRGYVILGIFIVAAFLTPADAISQTLMAVPMWLLYESGVVLSRILLKDRLARQAAEQSTTE